MFEKKSNLCLLLKLRLVEKHRSTHVLQRKQMVVEAVAGDGRFGVLCLHFDRPLEEIHLERVLRYVWMRRKKRKIRSF